jgi:hypothetical protein
MVRLNGQLFTTHAQSNLDTTHVIGGRRDIRLGVTGPLPYYSGSVQLIIDTTLGNFQYLADPGYTALGSFILYRGPTADLQADLTADGSNTLVFDFAFADFEPGFGNLDVTVDTTPGGRLVSVPIYTSATPFSIFLPFTAFNTPSAAANFEHVVSISYGTNGGYLQGDFTLTGIRTAYFPDGDYNYDGVVDRADFSAWKSRYQLGSYGLYAIDPADGNRDLMVNAADYTIWRNNFGASASGQATVAAVPEPTSFVLALVVLLAMTRFLQAGWQRR